MNAQRRSSRIGHKQADVKSYEQPPWLSWLERQSHNLEVVSSILTGGSFDFAVLLERENIEKFWLPGLPSVTP